MGLSGSLLKSSYALPKVADRFVVASELCGVGGALNLSILHDTADTVESVKHSRHVRLVWSNSQDLWIGVSRGVSVTS